MQDLIQESVKLQRIDLFVRLVAFSNCSSEEKEIALLWVEELTNELMAKVRNYERQRVLQENAG